MNEKNHQKLGYLIRSKNSNVWLVTVDMGYGHQRATYPLKHLAYKGIINANTYKGIPEKDKKNWLGQRRFYEAISRFKNVPIFGDLAFELFDKFQKISNYYPKRDLSKTTIQVAGAFRILKNNKLGEHLINKLKKRPEMPFVTSFFLTAFMAEVFEYPGEIYCVICDADISRAWVSENPKMSRIKYFAPCQRVVDRLKLYGVAEERIFLTGFPLPKENIGTEHQAILKKDLRSRLVNLDPNRLYLTKYKETLCKNLSIKSLPKTTNHPLTITFAVGGAGAQREIGGAIIASLKEKIRQGKVRVNLIAGIHHTVNRYFKTTIIKIGMRKYLGSGIRILFEPVKQKYFKKFNHWLRTTDILWTKPSELSFYTGLGIPIVMCPPIGSQEDFNRKYLMYLGAGIDQLDLKCINEWLFDWVNSGRLAEAAAQGFLEAPKFGTFNIEKILAKHAARAKAVKTISPY